jgi:hypothetical protein
MDILAIPVSVFQVEVEIASGRPFSMVEQTILHSISAGNDTYEALNYDIALHPRVTAEALTALFEAGIIEFKHGTGCFLITNLGMLALSSPAFVPETIPSCGGKVDGIGRSGDERDL